MSNVCFKWLVYTRIIPNTYVLGPVWPYPEGIWHDWQGLRMNDVPRTRGLWAASSPPGPAAPPLAGEVVADVASVGGGITGCSAAYHLARAGQAPVRLEAERLGFGGAGRHVGLMNAGLSGMPIDLLTTPDSPSGQRLLD